MNQFPQFETVPIRTQRDAQKWYSDVVMMGKRGSKWKSFNCGFWSTRAGMWATHAQPERLINKNCQRKSFKIEKIFEKEKKEIVNMVN